MKKLIYFWIKSRKSSINLARLVFLSSIALNYIGTEIFFLTDIDITSHGLIPTYMGILSLYFYHEAIIDKTKGRFRKAVVYLISFWVITAILLIISLRSYFLEIMKCRLVLISSLLIFIILIVKMLLYRRKLEKKSS